jgi:hypothetical protein
MRAACWIRVTRPSLKRLYHNFIRASLIKSSPKTFLIIGTVSADECPSLKQNLMQIRWSTRAVIVNPTVAQTQATSTASHYRLTSRTGEWLFTDAQKGLLWLAAKFHQGHATGSRDIKYGLILLGQTTYVTTTDSFLARSQNCEKRLLATSYLSVRLSAWNNSAPTRRICTKFDIRVFSGNSVVGKIQVQLKFGTDGGRYFALVHLW